MVLLTFCLAPLQTKALVTGCSGFLAGRIIDMLLARGISVRGCDIAPSNRSDIEYVKANLCNLEGMFHEQMYCISRSVFHCGTDMFRLHADVKKAAQGVDTIVHTAAAFYKAPADIVRAVNVDGTKNIVEAAIANGVKRIVYTSSGSVVFRGRDMNNIDESEPYAEPTLFFRDAYTLTKAEAERIVLAASGKNGLTTIALRPHQIYGPGDRHFIPAVAENARMNVIRLGRAGRKVTMTYVDNIAHAHVVGALALADPSRVEKVSGQPFNINDGEAVDFLEDVIFRAVTDIAGIPRARLGKIPIPFFLIYLIAFIAEMVTYVRKIDFEFFFFCRLLIGSLRLAFRSRA
jgi:nucleoside-diphosphate-sugar epimerase